MVKWLLAQFILLRRDGLEYLVDNYLETKLLYPRRYKLDKELEET